MLTLKAMGIENITSLDFMDKPKQSAMLAAFKTLISLGAIDAITAKLTKLGKEMSVLPTEPIY